MKRFHPQDEKGLKLTKQKKKKIKKLQSATLTKSQLTKTTPSSLAAKTAQKGTSQ